MSDPVIREFRLAKGRPDGLNPFLSDAGAFLADGTPLLERIGTQWRPRRLAALAARADSLATVAKALNRGDRSLAAIALVQAELPAFAKGDPDVASESRDGKGRWTVSAAGKAFIQRHEGFKPKAYHGIDAQNWTIAWGHNLGTIDPYDGKPIDAAEAQRLFDGDIAQAEALVQNKVRVPLTQNQYDAMVSFAYNFGPKGFQNPDGSQTQILRILNAGNYLGAANRLTEWNHDGAGKVSDGLTNRRMAEQNLFLSGVYQ